MSLHDYFFWESVYYYTIQVQFEQGETGYETCFSFTETFSRILSI